MSRHYYHRLTITIATRTRTIVIGCYCRFSANLGAAWQCAARAIERNGFGGVIGAATIMRTVARGQQLLFSAPVVPARGLCSI